MKPLGLLLLLSTAFAGQRIIRHAGDEQRIQTPFGEMMRVEARYLCVATTVYIGVTEDAVPIRKGRQPAVDTQLSVRTERTLLGDPGPFTNLTATSSSLASFGPSPDIGGRHLVGSVVMLVDAPPHRKKGDTLGTLTHRMNPDVELEPDKVLTKALDELCETQSLPRYEEVLKNRQSQPAR